MPEEELKFQSGVHSRCGERALLASPWPAAALVAAVVFLVFIRVVGADFVLWDDDISIYGNPGLGALSLDRLKWIFTDLDSTMRYVPLTLLGWSVTYSVAKLSPYAYHLGNLILHALNAGLLVWVLRKLLIAWQAAVSPHPDAERRTAASAQLTWAAALGALVWAVHPLRVEPVAWANARGYVQAIFFLLLSLGSYLSAHEEGRREGGRAWRLAVSAFCFACSLLSHPIGWGFFLVLIILDAYPLRRLGSRLGEWDRLRVRTVLWEKLPFAVVAVAVAVVTISVRLASAGVWPRPISLSEFGLLDRVMQGLYVWAYYLWRPWYPLDLAPAYTNLITFDPLHPLFLVSGGTVAGITLALVLLRKRWPLGLALWACNIALLAPVLGLMEHPHFTSDRYALAVGILWAVLLASALVKVPAGTFTSGLAFSGVVVISAGLGAMSIHQTRVWDNSRVLFEHTIRVLPAEHPWVSNVHRRLGMAYLQANQFEKTRACWEKAIRIDPDDYMTQRLLGSTLIHRGYYLEALPHLQELVHMRPETASAWLQLGTALTRLGELDQAQQELEHGLRLNPQDRAISDLLSEVRRAIVERNRNS